MVCVNNNNACGAFNNGIGGIFNGGLGCGIIELIIILIALEFLTSIFCGNGFNNGCNNGCNNNFCC